MKKEYTGHRVTLMACSSCNIDCKHCYISYKGNRKADELIDTCKKLSEKYRVKINGAEVLTNPKYLDAFPIIDQNFILTNGLAIHKNPDLLKSIKEKGIDNIHMSYHFGMHDLISKVPKQVIVENISEFNKMGMKTYLMTTLSKENYDIIDAACAEAYSLGAKGIVFNNYLLQGNAINDVDLALTKDEIDIVCNQIEKARKKYKREKFDICRGGSLGKNSCSEHNHFRCIAGIDQAVITPDNKVYPCFFLTKEGYEIGHFDGDKIFITKQLEHDCQECLSHNILNKNQKNRYYD